jgi:hypothetical protein
VAPPDGKGDQKLEFRDRTFQIGNIDEVCVACEQAGISFEIPRKELHPGVRIAPNGNVVEFVQRG